ncbi:MAG: protein tyrosine phosphatase family protein [Halarcobacter ebronensis]|uniref:protein tyrosine phosphatase family protein n=1 Tax=Halarcobacter ebronensis TaxID=1462615 RepID=UPI003C75B254
MNSILNYIKINENISTAGQPSVEQFVKIKDKNFDVVINLALSSATNALENEDKVVSELGMTYIHLPVDFEEPKLSDLNLFLRIMSSIKDKKVFIHCAKNYRVTAFMYIYHKHVLNTPFENIDVSIFEEWSPSQNWQSLMKTDFQKLELF